MCWADQRTFHFDDAHGHGAVVRVEIAVPWLTPAG